MLLHGELVTIREFDRTDLMGVAAIVGDDSVTTWLSFDSRTAAQAQDMLDGVIERAGRRPRAEWYCAVEASGALVGFVRLALSGVQAGKLGYAIRSDAWGNGYAADAAAAMLRFAFRDLGLHRVSAAIGPDNAASITVAQRVGMQYEGRIRDHVFTNGRWRDSLLYAALTTAATPSG